MFSDKTPKSETFLSDKPNTRQHSDATEELSSVDTYYESLDIENVEEPGELPPPLPNRLHGRIHARFQKRCHAGENDFLGHSLETGPETECEAEEPEGPPPTLSWRCPATLRVSLDEPAP